MTGTGVNDSGTFREPFEGAIATTYPGILQRAGMPNEDGWIL
jgi:hypothetical protein